MNDNRFLQKFKGHSDTELEQIINDQETFVEEARIAAIQLLKERNGKNDSIEKAEAEIESVKEHKRQLQEKIKEEHREDYSTEDPNAPKLYSKRVIMLFAALFSTIFGAVLMMINFKEVGNQKAKVQVLIFGILYTGLIIFIVNALDIQTNIGIALNWGGAAILTEYFWNKQLGKTIQYQTKNWTKPAIISGIITTPIILALINQ
jgi:cation transport ATPase